MAIASIWAALVLLSPATATYASVVQEIGRQELWHHDGCFTTRDANINAATSSFGPDKSSYLQGAWRHS